MLKSVNPPFLLVLSGSILLQFLVISFSLYCHDYFIITSNFIIVLLNLLWKCSTVFLWTFAANPFLLYCLKSVPAYLGYSCVFTFTCINYFPLFVKFFLEFFEQVLFPNPTTLPNLRGVWDGSYCSFMFLRNYWVFCPLLKMKISDVPISTE